MNRVRFVQLRCIKLVNVALCVMLVALVLLATRGNLNFLWMQGYYYVSNVKEKTVTKVREGGSSFFADLTGNGAGSYYEDSTTGYSEYSGSILTAEWIEGHNIDTTRMTEARWAIVEKAYYWCDYDGGAYILYSTEHIGSVNRHNATWEDYDNCVATKTKGYVDCSWFVHELYSFVGIEGTPPNTHSGTYANYGFKQIDCDDLLAGDVVAKEGHAQIFLGWVDPNDHTKGYYKAAANGINGNTEVEQVSIKTTTTEIIQDDGWDGRFRAFRHKKLPVGDNSTASIALSRIDITGNKGEAREYADCFTRTGFKKTWDADYYDFAMPYKLSCTDIGGVSDKVITTNSQYAFVGVNDSNTKGRAFSYWIQPEKLNLDDIKSKYPSWVCAKLPYEYDSESHVQVYKWKGKSLYAIALPKCLFPQSLAEQGFYAFSGFHLKGILADLILTDGTIINCVVTDAIGEGHSNGVGKYTINGESGWTAPVSSAQDGVTYHLNELKLPQYTKLFHAASLHTVELSGASDISGKSGVKQFMEYYNLSETSNTRISYIRIYKYSIKDNS